MLWFYGYLTFSGFQGSLSKKWFNSPRSPLCNMYCTSRNKTGVAVGQEVEWPLGNHEIPSSIPFVSPINSVKCPRARRCEPQTTPNVQVLVPYQNHVRLTWFPLPLVCECVCEWVNLMHNLCKSPLIKVLYK